MGQQTAVLKQANYGLEVPGVVNGMTITGVVSIFLGGVFYALFQSQQPLLAIILLSLGLVIGFFNLIIVGGMTWSSKVGKLRERDRLLDGISWRGDETVLDVGCGRGLLLISAAKRLQTGKAIGVDIWKNDHHSDNRPEATWENGHAEGVADRIEVKNGDARQLPFENDVFDVVVSSLTLHNIPEKSGRDKALHEIIRVLKPGGRLALLDIKYTDEYAALLRENDIQDVRRIGPRFLFFLPVYTVSGHL